MAGKEAVFVYESWNFRAWQHRTTHHSDQVYSNGQPSIFFSQLNGLIKSLARDHQTAACQHAFFERADNCLIDLSGRTEVIRIDNQLDGSHLKLWLGGLWQTAFGVPEAGGIPGLLCTSVYVQCDRIVHDERS